MNKRLIALLAILSLFLTSPLIPANAVEYVTISGKVVDNSGQPKRIIYLISSINEITLGQTKTEDVNFTLQVPKDVKIKLSFVYYSNPNLSQQYLIQSGWQTEKTFTKDENLNFIIPNMVKITGRVQNYSGNPFYRAGIYYGTGASLDHDSVDINGNGQLWIGSGLATQAIANNDGSFILYTFKAASVNYVNRFRVSVISQENSNSIWFTSAAYKSLSDDNLLFCVRSENESNLNPPSSCIKDQATEILEIETSKQKSTNSAQQFPKDLTCTDADFVNMRISLNSIKSAYQKREKQRPDLSKVINAEINKIDQFLSSNPSQCFIINKFIQDAQKKILNLPTEMSKYSITCTKGKTTKKVSGTNPKCPKGYKKVS